MYPGEERTETLGGGERLGSWVQRTAVMKRGEVERGFEGLYAA